MRGSLTRLGGSIFVTGLIGLGLGLASPAHAADDGYANVFSSVLGAVGLIKPDPGPEIEYRERPPLVLPAQATLPKPVPSGTKRIAAWPHDPDVERRRKDAEEARAPRNNPMNDKEEVLSGAEMAKGRGQSEAVKPNDCGVNGNARGCLVISPDELKAEGDRFASMNPGSTDTVTAGKEPDRVYLTQPPKGYMKATRTVKATAEAPEPKVDDSNPRTFLMPQKKDDE